MSGSGEIEVYHDVHTEGDYATNLDTSNDENSSCNICANVTQLRTVKSHWQKNYVLKPPQQMLQHLYSSKSANDIHRFLLLAIFKMHQLPSSQLSKNREEHVAIKLM